MGKGDSGGGGVCRVIVAFSCAISEGGLIFGVYLNVSLRNSLYSFP